MIMRTLNPVQASFGPVDVDSQEAAILWGQMLADDVSMATTAFQDRNGEITALFWSLDHDGHVCTLWEHTMTHLVFPIQDTEIDVRTMPVR